MMGSPVLEKGGDLSLYSFLSPDLVMFLEKSSRDEILFDLTELVNQAGLLRDKMSFFRAIVERERIMSTGIGMGVAIPHGKLFDRSDFFVAIGIHPEGVAWDAIDGAPVRLIFLVGGPDDQQHRYLRLLSELTLSIKDENKRRSMLQAKTPTEIINLFSED